LQIAKPNHDGRKAQEARRAAELIPDGGHYRFWAMVQQAQHKQVEVCPPEAKGLQSGRLVWLGRG
jgi:hypothetical protein